jgi:hypothetical protein
MAKSRSDPDQQHCYLVYPYITREVVVYMERPIEPNKGTSVTDILLCTLESTNAGLSSFPVRYTSVLRVIIVSRQDFLINETLQLVDILEE